jgi:hypothetical protein
MHFKNIVSTAQLAIMATKGMAAPLPGPPDKPYDKTKPIGHTRLIEKEDIGFRKTRPEGCIRWVSRGPLLGYCGKWEDVVVREEDIPDDSDDEPPRIISHDSSIQVTDERPVGCIDWVDKGTAGYCRAWEDVEIPKELQPKEEDGSDGNRDHEMRTCTRRPPDCYDWMQVEPTKGYCTYWKGEVDDFDVIKAQMPGVDKVEKRNVDKAKTREKSPFDIAMPFWTIGAL